MRAETMAAPCPPEEDPMTPRNPAANRVAVLFAAVTIGAVGFISSPAGAQAPAPTPKEAKRQYDNRGHLYYGPSGPNVSYQQGPHTRVYISKRSWLDAGVEVKPGDRHYLDYVMTPGGLQQGYNAIIGPAAPAGFQNPYYPRLGPFEAPDPYRVGW
jgi:hypothetical protein